MAYLITCSLSEMAPNKQAFREWFPYSESLAILFWVEFFDES